MLSLLFISAAATLSKNACGFLYEDVIINHVFTDYLLSLFYTSEFQDFMDRYNKTYRDQNEYNEKFNIFVDNLEYIHDHNTNRETNGLTYSLAMNKFGDMPRQTLSSVSFDNHYLRINNYNNVQKNTKTSAGEQPDSLDWREKNVVTPVKNQGQCGSCWAFSTTGAVESLWALHSGQLLSLSEQQLMDCSSPEGDESCNGGLMDYAFQYYLDQDGACLEKDYPYKGRNERTCRNCTRIVRINGYNDVQKNNETALKYQVAVQPVSIGVDANLWQFYNSGVFNNLDCGYDLNHGVLLVGYGSENGQDYWLVRNSWCEQKSDGYCEWGENGYIRLRRNINDPRGLCGIATHASYPFIDAAAELL